MDLSSSTIYTYCATGRPIRNGMVTLVKDGPPFFKEAHEDIRVDACHWHDTFQIFQISFKKYKIWYGNPAAIGHGF